MIHSIGYHGPFEENFKHLKPGATSYRRKDHSRKSIPRPSRHVNGVRFGYMEKPLKQFVAVRAEFRGIDVILKRELNLPPRGRRMGGKGFGPRPTHLRDSVALRLLQDMSQHDAAQRSKLRRIIRTLKSALRV